jgi:hypothetical protein
MVLIVGLEQLHLPGNEDDFAPLSSVSEIEIKVIDAPSAHALLLAPAPALGLFLDQRAEELFVSRFTVPPSYFLCDHHQP